MAKTYKKLILLFVTIFILIILSSASIYAWDDCPFNLENDYYPGECGRYIDTDDDGICDHSQPAPENRENLIAYNLDSTKENIENPHQEEHKTSLPDYNFLEIFFISLFIYFSVNFLARKLQITLSREKKFWNTILLISFIGSAGLGMILVFIRDFEWFKNINLNFLFWHVEFSIVMTFLGIFHALWHLKYYLSIFKRKKEI